MKDKLVAALLPLGYPVHLQGTIAENEPYPDSFITFFTTDSETVQNFDNAEALTAWQYQVFFYSADPATMKSAPQTIRATLKAAGFIPQGKGYDIPSDQPTHTGWVCEYLYLENEGVL